MQPVLAGEPKFKLHQDSSAPSVAIKRNPPRATDGSEGAECGDGKARIERNDSAHCAENASVPMA